jgi:rubrerythrin
MHLTSRAFRRLAADVDEFHHEQMKTFEEESADLHLDAVRASRRGFLVGSAAVAGTAAALAMPLFTPRGWSPFAAAAAAQTLDDQTIAGYAQSVELAAVAAYMAAAPVLSSATKPVAELFMSHHQQHAEAFGAVAGDKKATGPNQKLVTALTPTLQGIKDEMGALDFAFTLENQAAYTYAAALTLLQDPKYAAATATILPIEAQHAVVLGLAVGKSVPDVFPTQAFESSALGDGTDPLAGLDPKVFAG